MRNRRFEASACSHSPVAQEPVNDTALSGPAFTSARPSSPPDPATKLTTPLGAPAWCSASTMRHALNGAADAGILYVLRRRLDEVADEVVGVRGVAVFKQGAAAHPFSVNVIRISLGHKS